MLTRWVFHSPSRLRGISSTAPQLSDSIGQRIPRAALCNTQNTVVHSWARDAGAVLEAENPVSDDVAVKRAIPDKRPYEGVSWSVHRNHLRNLRHLKVRQGEVNNGALPERQLLEDLNRRIPDLSTALTLNNQVDSENVRRAESSSTVSFTHDCAAGGSVPSRCFNVLRRPG